MTKISLVVSYKTRKANLILQGILESVDNNICAFFVSDPNETFVSKSMSSFERLLAHACSVYYQLKSYSELSLILVLYASFLFKVLLCFCAGAHKQGILKGEVLLYH